MQNKPFKIHNSVEFSAFTVLCNYSLCLFLNVNLIPKGDISSLRRPCIHNAWQVFPSPSPTSGNHPSAFCLYGLAYFGQFM